MKKKDLAELKNKSVDSLKKEIERVVKEKNDAKIDRDINKTKNVHRILKLRRDIAQIKTILALKQFVEKSEHAN